MTTFGLGNAPSPSNRPKSLAECKDYLIASFAQRDHPLHKMVNLATESFKFSYTGLGANRRLLTDAINEVPF